MQVFNEISNISPNEEVLLSPHYADKGTTIVKAIEWHKGDKEDEEDKLKGRKKEDVEVEKEKKGY